MYRSILVSVCAVLCLAAQSYLTVSPWTVAHHTPLSILLQVESSVLFSICMFMRFVL